MAAGTLKRAHDLLLVLLVFHKIKFVLNESLCILTLGTVGN